MVIDISQILSVKDKEMILEADIEMDRFKSRLDDYAFKEKNPVKLELKNKGKKKFKLTADIDVTLIIPCGRCLKDVEYPMHIKVDKTIDMNESKNDEDYDADDNSFVEESNLDVERLVYKELLINMPMKVLCSEDCQGISNRCGSDDTTELDPRMSKIKDIFNKFKEV